MPIDDPRIIPLQSLHNSGFRECDCVYCSGVEVIPWRVRRANARRVAAEAILAETHRRRGDVSLREKWARRWRSWTLLNRHRWSLVTATVACWFLSLRNKG